MNIRKHTTDWKQPFYYVKKLNPMVKYWNNDISMVFSLFLYRWGVRVAYVKTKKLIIFGFIHYGKYYYNEKRNAIFTNRILQKAIICTM